MNSNSNYETLYGVGLLDDLHNYFPALLYDSSGFRSVQDVLGYVHQQTRNRFDLFSYGLREYVGTSRASVAGSSLRTFSSQVPPSGGGRPSTLPTASTTRGPLNIQIDVETTEDDADTQTETQPDTDTDTETRVANALLSLLQLPTTALTRNYVLPNLNTGRVTLDQMMFRRTAMDEFLQPVVIRPTPEQIAQNTTLGRLVSDTEHSCAVCQDILSSEQEGRKLNACGHWFHKTCIDTWLQGNVNCPVCRHDIREPLASS